MKEFGYFGELELPLGDEIELCSNSQKNFIVANNKALNAQIIANEIDYYIQNSDESVLDISKNISILYEARAVGFDGSKYEKFSKKVGKNVLLVGDNQSLASSLENSGFKVVCVDEIEFIYGCAGELSALIEQNKEKIELECDFAIFCDPQPYALRQSGCLDASSMNQQQILDFLLSHSPSYNYQNYILCDTDACLYHHKRENICAKCADICPSVAILKNEEEKELVFSPIDCIACGRCVSICPSGAIDNAVLTRVSIAKIAKLYKGKIPLILKDGFLPSVRLKNGVLPFILPSDGILDLENILSLVLSTSSQIIIFLPSLAQASLDAILLANEIFSKAFGKKMIILCKDENELKNAINSAKMSVIGDFDFSEFGSKAAKLAAKLALIANGKDLGVFKTTDSTAHAKISIDEQKCTLCASCAGACITGALIADSTNNAILFNESLCVGCEYCAKSCAESDAIKIQKGQMHIRPEFFEPQELARDELFACVECGKEFATKKAVEKVASTLLPVFKGNEKKIKSLYCCADCKAKMMILDQGVLDV